MPKERFRIKHKKTLGLQLSLILSTKTAYNNKTKNNKKQKFWGRVIILPGSNVQCSTTTTKSQGIQNKTQKSIALQRKKKFLQNLSLKNTLW